MTCHSSLACVLPGTSQLLVTAGCSQKARGLPCKHQQPAQVTLCQRAQQGQGSRVCVSARAQPPTLNPVVHNNNSQLHTWYPGR